MAGPLKRTDCSLVSDGAAAQVLTRKDAESHGAGRSTSNHRARPGPLLPMSKRDILLFGKLHRGMAARALQSAKKRSSICPLSKPTTLLHPSPG